MLIILLLAVLLLLLLPVHSEVGRTLRIPDEYQFGENRLTDIRYPAMFWHSFAHLVQHGDFVGNTTYFMTWNAPETDSVSSSDTLLSQLREEGWNVSLRSVRLVELESTWMTSYLYLLPMCRVLSTDSPDDNITNYRTVADIMSARPTALNAMYIPTRQANTDCHSLAGTEQLVVTLLMTGEVDCKV